MFKPAEQLSQVLQDTESHLQLMNLEIPQSKRKAYVPPPKVDMTVQDFYKTLEHKNNQSSI